jgi:hypothetical protein
MDMRTRAFLTVLALAPGASLAQGISSLQVTAITPSPLPFKVESAITFKLTVKNPTTNRLALTGYDVFLTVFQGDVCHRVNDPGCRVLWRPGSARMKGPISAGGTVQVTFPGSFNVSEAAEKFCFSACAIDPPNEFCIETTVCATATCSYMIPLTVRPVLGKPMKPAATAPRSIMKRRR